MKPAVRLAVMAAGIAAVLGVRSWRENERGKQVWSSATDALDHPGTARQDHAEPHN